MISRWMRRFRNTIPLTACATLLVFQTTADAQQPAARFNDAETPKLLPAAATLDGEPNTDCEGGTNTSSGDVLGSV